MTSLPLQELGKKARFAVSFLRQKLLHVNLQILYACNFRCQICDFWKETYRDKPRLSVAGAEIISDKLNQIGPQIISLTGGEPLLHAELPDIVRALARHHFPVMITNGWHVKPEGARALFEAGMMEISVSVDYADAARHDAQRGVRGASDRALRALQVLHENRTRPHQRVNMISVVMDDNLDEIEPLARLCERMGITYLVTLYSPNRGTKAPRVIPTDASRRLLDLKRRCRHFVALRGYVARFSEALARGGIGPCSTGKNLCHIDSQGDVTFCIDRLTEPVGNILTDDIHTIYQALLEAHARNDCRACWTSCRGYVEALLYGKHRLGSLFDYYQMTRPVPLGRAF